MLINHDKKVICSDRNECVGKCFYLRPQTLNTESYIIPFLQALELAAKNVVAIVGPGSTSVAVHLASLMGTLTRLLKNDFSLL